MEQYWIVAELQRGLNNDSDSLRFIEQYETQSEAKELQIALNRLDKFFSTYVIIPPNMNHLLANIEFIEIGGKAKVYQGYLEEIEHMEET